MKNGNGLIKVVFGIFMTLLRITTKPSVRISCVPAQIQAKYFLNESSIVTMAAVQ
jgi:hypothetical protein